MYSLAVVLTDAAAGRPVAPADISQLGRSMAPVGGGTATARNVARLAPLLAQASATRPENRLEADELALALRATAEMFPPPTRLDEAFRRAEEYEARPASPEPGETGPVTQPDRIRGLALRSVAAAAIVVAAALLVIFSAPGDDTPARAVPGVVGMDWSEASETLAASGWEVRRLDVRVPGASPDEVVGQLPSQGGLLDEGQTVKVQVSLGEPLVVIPADIVGMTVEEAGLRLSEIGLRVGIVQTSLDPAVPEGSVVAVNEMLPELPRGSAVDLVVAVGG
ncbi:MAG: PASTA domain-containing protein [Acidimicrobiia bacterium]|nr:PASTA domain-containing protein [Acidimicrobiia bacterium]